jgi:STE24 endopeptidase
MNVYLTIVLGILVAELLLNAVAEMLNLRHMSTELPDEFCGDYDAARYATSQKYLRDNTRFGLVEHVVFTAVTLAMILAGGFNAVDRLVRAAAGNPIGTGLLFGGVLLIGTRLLHVPFEAYQTFVIEERYGFNRTTRKTFVLDIVKECALGAAVGGALLAAVLWLFETAGSAAWLCAWGVACVFQGILVFLAPVLIMPLFNKFRPLEDGDVRRDIEAYARAQGFRMKGVFTMDGSRRSSKSNAFFTGFGRFRRIVLLDTLLARHPPDELLAVLAHEVGHYRRRHVLKGMILRLLTTGLALFVLSLLVNNPRLSAAFRMEHVSVYSTLMFAAFLYSPLALAISIAENALSRRWEYEADAFAATTTRLPTESLIRALKKLTVDNLGNLSPHPLKVLLSYSHPPILDRIRSLRANSVPAA